MNTGGEILNVLEKAVEHLEQNPESWCQGHRALAEAASWRRTVQMAVSPKNPNAVKFCALGICELYAEDNTNHLFAVSLLEAAMLPGPSHRLEDWNDNPDRTYEEVVELFHKAIKLLKESS